MKLFLKFHIYIPLNFITVVCVFLATFLFRVSKLKKKLGTNFAFSLGSLKHFSLDGLNIINIRDMIYSENSYNPSVLVLWPLRVLNIQSIFKNFFSEVILTTAFDLQKITT